MTEVLNDQEKEELRRLDQEEEELGKLVQKVFNQIRIFPGSQAEYENCRGYLVEVIDLGRKSYGLFVGKQDYGHDTLCAQGMEEEGDMLSLLRQLDKEGVEAIVNAEHAGGHFYGLPVRKKQ